jgi:hypothetical protein
MSGLAKIAVMVVATSGLLATGWADRAAAVALTCGSFQGPDCGGAEGDAACGSPSLDCIDTGQGCECEQRSCCRCDAVPGTDSQACNLPCEDAVIDRQKCAAMCFEAVMSGATCNLTVLLDKHCGDGSCVAQGCCAATITTGDDSPPFNICAESDAATCAIPGGTFIPGGHCAGGVTGTCVPDKSNGSVCTDASECASGFCADGVCCNTACDGADEECDLPGQSGTCSGPPAPAPAMGAHALSIAMMLLSAIAAVALRRRRIG